MLLLERGERGAGQSGAEATPSFTPRLNGVRVDALPKPLPRRQKQKVPEERVCLGTHG